MAKKDTLSLKEFVAQSEAAAQPLTIVEVTHPDAKDGDIYEGTYSGIRMVKGDMLVALLSSGKKI